VLQLNCSQKSASQIVPKKGKKKQKKYLKSSWLQKPLCLVINLSPQGRHSKSEILRTAAPLPAATSYRGNKQG